MTPRPKLIAPAIGIWLAVTVIVITLAFHEKRAAANEPSPDNSVVAASCRAGVSAHGPDQAALVDDVGAGWYVFFGGYEAAQNGASIAPVISVKQNKDGAKYLDSYTISPSLAGLLQLLQTYPGTLWIVGSEVDRGPDPGQTTSGQGDTFPDVYARAYEEVYHFIKHHDPTALVANAALVQVTPGRLQYLDLMWQSYYEQFGEPMPVDVWNMHIYVLPEAELDGTPNGIASVALGTDPALAKRGPGAHYSQCSLDEIYCYAEHDDLAIFGEQVRAMRLWMDRHGQQQKPLILTEFSILYPCDDPAGTDCDYLRDEFGNDFDKQRVQNWLAASTAYLEGAIDPQIGYSFDGGRLVQQWAWFSIRTTTSVGDVSDLVDSSQAGDQLTELGQQYQALATTMPIYTNLAPARVDPVTADTGSGGGTVDVTLKASVTNNGSIPVDSPFRITFYADSGLTQVIGHAEAPAPDQSNPGLVGCALRTITLDVTWPSLGPGLHPFWVEVDSQNDVNEGGPPGRDGESDNVVSSFVLVNPRRVRLPVALR